eukprot:gene17161-biopygen20345
MFDIVPERLRRFYLAGGGASNGEGYVCKSVRAQGPGLNYIPFSPVTAAATAQGDAPCAGRPAARVLGEAGTREHRARRSSANFPISPSLFARCFTEEPRAGQSFANPFRQVCSLHASRRSLGPGRVCQVCQARFATFVRSKPFGFGQRTAAGITFVI